MLAEGRRCRAASAAGRAWRLIGWNNPFFDAGLRGGSLLIAGVAIFHIFIAHFSVGSGFLMALTQRRAIRDNDLDMDRAIGKYAFGVLLVPYVLGTVTGVGIWFCIALVSPRAVSILIHQFVWTWCAKT